MLNDTYYMPAYSSPCLAISLHAEMASGHSALQLQFKQCIPVCFYHCNPLKMWRNHFTSSISYTYALVSLTDCFHWMSIFSNHAKWCLIRMMYLVNIFVQSFVMHQSMYPVMPCILDHWTGKYLQQHQQFLESTLPLEQQHANRSVSAFIFLLLDDSVPDKL